MLVWGGLGTLWIAAICGVLALASGLGSRFILGPDVSQQAGTLGPGGHTHFSDPLTTLDSYWSTPHNYCAFRDGAYHITPTGQDMFQICYGNIGRFGDFDAQVTATPIAGPAAANFGLVFRSVDPGDGYIFEVTAGGNARFDLLIAGAIAPLPGAATFALPAASPGGEGGGDYTLRVVAHGSQLNGYVNGRLLISVYDTHFAAGGIGLAAGGTGTDVAFTNFLLQAA